jgi:hypothetical protein
MGSLNFAEAKITLSRIFRLHRTFDADRAPSPEYLRAHSGPKHPIRREVGIDRDQPDHKQAAENNDQENNTDDIPQRQSRPNHLKPRHSSRALTLRQDGSRNGALDFCFDAFSSREPASTSLENALDFCFGAFS